MPKAGTIAYLMNPNNPNWELGNVQAAARSLGQQILVLNADGDREIDTAFATIAQQRVAALLVASDPLFFDRRDQLIALAAGQAIPAVYYLRAFSQAGTTYNSLSAVALAITGTRWNGPRFFGLRNARGVDQSRPAHD
jgi:putative ABC transport system substrate-binding protein